jgi:hypothetical protein
VVVDLYDPFLIENLHYHRELGLEPYRTDHATWRLQLSRGDLFLCSSEEQRLYYLGWLTALGRVNPLSTEEDPSLRGLIVELPFGTPDAVPPRRRRGGARGRPEDAPVLYFGGIYDWYDLAGAGRAAPPAAEDARTVVVRRAPHPELTPLAAACPGPMRSRPRLARREVRFEDWRAYDQRFDLAQASDLGVVTHRPGLETDLSLRTRLVDLLWLGLPVVVTEGGTMAQVVRRTGAGETVPAGDAAALAAAVRRLRLDPDRRHLASEAGRRWAAERTWSRAGRAALASPSGRSDPQRDRFADLAPEASRRGSVATACPVARRSEGAVKARSSS